ncbi:MAG: S49 family peptidase [Gammaproteobacteria bacterium]
MSNIEDNQNQSGDSDMNKDIINRLVFSSLNEQRRTRRWSIFFKFLTFALLFGYLAIFMAALSKNDSMAKLGKDGPHTALINIQGVISSSTEANADNIISGLREAFKNKNTKGIILRINSPGGSPVQSGYINDEIHRLREKNKDIPVYAVIVDVCASGGYYIASAADKIYADKASIVGSIGVLMNGFGFVDTMKKIGVERRLYTAGANKGFLDPFTPAKKEDIKHIEKMLGSIHQQFINVVKKGRGDRLKDSPNLYSGYVWTGEQSVAMGLVDGLGSSSYVAREIIKAEEIVDFTPKPSYLDQFAKQFGASFGATISSALGLNSVELR